MTGMTQVDGQQRVTAGHLSDERLRELFGSIQPIFHPKLRIGSQRCDPLFHLQSQFSFCDRGR
jgi:hypothetical protein